MTSSDYLRETLRNLDLLMKRNDGTEAGDWPLHDKLRLMAVMMDQEHHNKPEHEIQDDLRRAGDILELHTIHTLEATS